MPKQLVFQVPLNQQIRKNGEGDEVAKFFISDFMMCVGCVGLDIFILDQIGSTLCMCIYIYISI